MSPQIPASGGGPLARGPQARTVPPVTATSRATGPSGRGPGPGAARNTVRVVVARTGPGSSADARWTLDSRLLGAADARHLSDLVDAVEAAGPPAGGTAALGAWRDCAGYEITVARGYGHWIARIGDGHLSGELARLVHHVVSGEAFGPPAGDAPGAA